MILRKQKLLVYNIHEAQISFQAPPNPKFRLIGPKKAQNDPKKGKIKKSENKKSYKINKLQKYFSGLTATKKYLKKAKNYPKITLNQEERKR